jgi:hypothetical protein
MKKFTFKKISFLVLFVLTFSVNAQTNNILQRVPSEIKHTYYVDVRQVATKAICLDIENKISDKKGVISFRTVGFPSKYFVLKTETAIKETDLKIWLQENGLEMAFFVEGKSGLEELIYRKQKK